MGAGHQSGGAHRTVMDRRRSGGLNRTSESGKGFPPSKSGACEPELPLVSIPLIAAVWPRARDRNAPNKQRLALVASQRIIEFIRIQIGPCA